MSKIDLYKGILFKTEMVKAILDGKKTQFRRVVLNEWIKSDKAPILTHGEDGCIWYFWNFGEKQSKYKVGDILYVKETFCYDRDGYAVFKLGFVDIPFADGVEPKWRPSVHLKQKDARIFLKITDVRVEKLQDISRGDISKEGCPNNLRQCKNYQDEMIKWWISLWSTNAPKYKVKRDIKNKIQKHKKIKKGYSWEDNPYVFVYDFEIVEIKG